MNREYNDNREYKNALDELHFSEEAKNRMVERLMAAAEQPAQPFQHAGRACADAEYRYTASRYFSGRRRSCSASAQARPAC